MRILLIEDDPNKEANLLSYLLVHPLSPSVDVARSYQSGYSKLLKSNYDYVLLDMSLPNYDRRNSDDGSPFRHYGGRDLMHEMLRKNVQTKVIVVTQFDVFGKGGEEKTLEELTSDLERTFSPLYIGTVYYNASESDWKNKISDYLQRGQDQ